MDSVLASLHVRRTLSMIAVLYYTSINTPFQYMHCIDYQ